MFAVYHQDILVKISTGKGAKAKSTIFRLCDREKHTDTKSTSPVRLCDEFKTMFSNFQLFFLKVTAYDFPSGRFARQAGVELVLVGDSAGPGFLCGIRFYKKKKTTD